MRIYPRPSSPDHAPHQLRRAGGVALAYRDLGPPDAPAWVVLHGGPGSASHPGLWQAFDLRRQRVVVADQRGAGHSSPAGHTRANDLAALVADIEALRHHLGIARWSVLGGSWGATLAMAYASAHPDRVTRIVLRGTFDGREHTVHRLFSRFAVHGHAKPCPRPPAFRHAQLFQLLHLFQFGTPNGAQRRALQQWAHMERTALLHGMARSVAELPPSPRRQQARAQVRALRRNLLASTVAGRPSQSTHVRHWLALQQAYRIQAHYLAHRCFLRPGAWAQMADAVARAAIPCQIVHGRHDQACPLPISQRLAHTLGAGTAWTAAGHLSGEPATREQLTQWLQASAP